MSQAQIVSEFVTRTRSYTLLNSSDDDIGVMAGGMYLRVPGAGKIQPPHPKYDDAFHSLELDGDFIPGTLTIFDKVISTEESKHGEAHWLAADAIKLILGISAATGQASSGYAQRGLSLLPSTATRAEIDQLRKEGRDRWQLWRIEQARTLVAAHEERNEIRRKLNVPLSPGGPEYLKALHLLNAAEARDRVQAQESLEATEQPSADELATLLKEKLAEIQLGRTALTSSELVEKLLGDPKAMAILKETHKVRKHRGPNKSKAGTGDDEQDE